MTVDDAVSLPSLSHPSSERGSVKRPRSGGKHFDPSQDSIGSAEQKPAASLLMDLPPELLSNVEGNLCTRDLLHLSSTAKRMHEFTEPARLAAGHVDSLVRSAVATPYEGSRLKAAFTSIATLPAPRSLDARSVFHREYGQMLRDAAPTYSPEQTQSQLDVFRSIPSPDRDGLAAALYIYAHHPTVAASADRFIGEFGLLHQLRKLMPHVGTLQLSALMREVHSQVLDAHLPSFVALYDKLGRSHREELLADFARVLTRIDPAATTVPVREQAVAVVSQALRTNVNAPADAVRRTVGYLATAQAQNRLQLGPESHAALRDLIAEYAPLANARFTSSNTSSDVMHVANAALLARGYFDTEQSRDTVIATTVEALFDTAITANVRFEMAQRLADAFAQGRMVDAPSELRDLSEYALHSAACNQQIASGHRAALTRQLLRGIGQHPQYLDTVPSQKRWNEFLTQRLTQNDFGIQEKLAIITELANAMNGREFSLSMVTPLLEASAEQIMHAPLTDGESATSALATAFSMHARRIPREHPLRLLAGRMLSHVLVPGSLTSEKLTTAAAKFYVAVVGDPRLQGSVLDQALERRGSQFFSARVLGYAKAQGQRINPAFHSAAALACGLVAGRLDALPPADKMLAARAIAFVAARMSSGIGTLPEGSRVGVRIFAKDIESGLFSSKFSQLPREEIDRLTQVVNDLKVKTLPPTSAS